MRSGKRVAIIGAALLAVGGAVVVGTNQAQAAPANYQYRDYLRPEAMKNAATTKGIQGIGMSECSKPAAERTAIGSA